MGKPLLRALYTDIRDDAPGLTKLLAQPWFDDLLAVLLVVLAIYGLGWLTNQVVGRQLLTAFEDLLARLPIISRSMVPSRSLSTCCRLSPTAPSAWC